MVRLGNVDAVRVGGRMDSSQQGMKLCKSGGKVHLDLFPHNQRAYDTACHLLKEEGRAAVIHPTGTGKSFLGFRLVLDNPQACILWLSPSEYIFQTQVKNLKKNLSGSGQEREVVLGQIKTQLEFMTYSKLMLCADSFSGKKLDYIILDEFHRCGAAEWGKGIQKLLLGCPKAKILGLSATNVRYLDGQRDMAEELFGGCVASKMTLGEAVAEEILPAPLYVVSMYSYQEELERLKERVKNGRDFSIKKQNEELLEKLRRSLEQADGLEKIFARHMKDREGKYIVFCSGKQHMEEMISHVGEWFQYVDRKPHIYRVTFDDSSAGRQFEAFQKDESSHLKLLFCIDMLNEGVHMEGVDGVILLRPTVSPTLYLQQIGRCLAAGKGKKGQPVIFDIVNNFESLSLVDSLQGEFGQALAFLRSGVEVEKKCQGCFQVVDGLLDCRKLFKAICHNLSSSWDVYYQEAEAFYKREGHLEVKKQYVTESGLSLGAWLLTQRRVYAGTVAGELSEGQVKRLDAIGMRWVDKRTAQFEKGLAAFKGFVMENGHGDTGSQYMAEDGFPLGKWLSNMRFKYKKGVLGEREARELSKAGMVWDVSRYRWEEYYKAAEKYKKQFGNLDIPCRYMTEDGKKLGIWLNNQKSSYLGKENKTCSLDAEQVQRLEALGIRWEKLQRLDNIGLAWEKEDSWEYRYSLSKAYYKLYGNLDVSQQYISEEGIWLGKWIYTQRMRYREGTLEAWKKERLDAIGMVWDSASERAFEKGCHALEKYLTQNQEQKIRKNYIMPDGYCLGSWVYRQKRKKREGKLTAEQAEKLKILEYV